MDNYNIIKQQASNGNITQDLFPYLWEYYEDVCNKKLVASYEQFLHYFTAYINMPVLTFDQQILIPVQGLMKRLPDIFNHLDRKYEEAAEK